jgi:DNA-binding transcriptional ArsR family regulator
MPNDTIELDRVFRALADPTRRKVIERLVSGPFTTSELARPFEMALPSFTQHLGVLEDAGLVASSKTGRIRTYRLAPGGMEQAGGWLGAQRASWERRLDQLDALVKTLEEES